MKIISVHRASVANYEWESKNCGVGWRVSDECLTKCCSMGIDVI